MQRHASHNNRRCLFKRGHSIIQLRVHQPHCNSLVTCSARQAINMTTIISSPPIADVLCSCSNARHLFPFLFPYKKPLQTKFLMGTASDISDISNLAVSWTHEHSVERTNNTLIVALCVCNSLLSVPTVAECANQLLHAPCLIWIVLLHTQMDISLCCCPCG